ncbi:MAG: hypothetical protein WBE13_07850 [Candidatus Acidiferrum sp.]
MNQFQRGVLFAVIQVALVSSLGAKLMWDRETLPRGWAATRGYDPDLPIRGRYINISLLVKADKVFPSLPTESHNTAPSCVFGSQNVYLTVENGRVVANPADHFTGLTVSGPRWQDGEMLAMLSPPVVYFLPEHALNPMSGRPTGTLFLELTVPREGPPRPIRFGTRAGGEIISLPAE